MTALHRPLLALATTFSLAACTFSFSTGGMDEPAENVAEAAMAALEEEVGQRPDSLDCGHGDVAIREGNQIACVLTHEGVEFDTAVTISDVDGSRYTVNVEVASTPNPTEEEPS
ncbi:DUF4333 domain-containing protein [Aeromicrobium phragmitis]|uniref:DUF4333 domain-containing protein n=1 Tax=Aeromicrobium phragmitis TaxID=2478914 RepID=A0A3L8PQA4_9ACTN|nr:DUF4333 domain-containing protein [Aeromicrobium phragmitis]RLV56212.1 DUF4333 domain-containing protein [Aeromicrobium phragmitis]